MALGLVLALAASACGSSSTGQALTGTGDRRPPVREFLHGTVAATNAFATDLYLAAAAGAPGNFAYPSLALATTLAMARAGAAGVTRQQLDTALHAALTPNLDEGLNTLDQELRDRGGDKRNAHRKGRVEREQAIALWGQKGTHVKQDLLDLLSTDYGQSFRLADFHADAEAARDEVNNWVADTTHGMVKELASRGEVSPYTRFLTVTGSTLRAPWSVPFDPDKTRADPFRREGAPPVDARMMEVTTDGLRRAEGDGWQAVELPYLGDQLALDLLWPPGAPLAELEPRLDPGLLGAVFERLDGAEPAVLDLRVPQFAFTTSGSLRDPLARMGVTQAFGREADFSGVTSDEVLSLADVLVESAVGIDEEGTIARSDTATVEAAPPSLQGTTRLVVDRPFLFVLRDRPTGAVLAIGRVASPV